MTCAGWVWKVIWIWSLFVVLQNILLSHMYIIIRTACLLPQLLQLLNRRCCGQWSQSMCQSGTHSSCFTLRMHGFISHIGASHNCHGWHFSCIRGGEDDILGFLRFDIHIWILCYDEIWKKNEHGNYLLPKYSGPGQLDGWALIYQHSMWYLKSSHGKLAKQREPPFNLNFGVLFV